MLKKIALLAACAVFGPVGIGNAQVNNPGTLVFLWTDGIQSLDPAYIGNTPSTYASLNMYNRLLGYDGSNISEFVPSIASKVPSLENGLIETGEDGSVRYTFPIREGIYAHKVGLKGADGKIEWRYYDELNEEERGRIEPGYGEITAEDVRYSFMRAILQGESWMANAVTEMVTAGTYPNIRAWATALAGVENFDDLDEAGLVAVHDALAEKITVEDGKLVLTLEKSFPATLGVIALPYATSVIDREWAVDHGAWPGTADSWVEFHKPDLGESALFEQANGSGPFMLEEWDQGEKRLVMKRFEGYMDGPAQLERVVLRSVPEWTTRRLQLEAGDADVVATPVEFLKEMKTRPGIKVREGLQNIFGRSLFFMWPVQADGNPAIGSGKLDGAGIPPDFFGDIDVRKGFNYAQNYQLLLEQVNLGNTVQLRGPTVRGLMGYRDDSPVYSFDPEKAEEHFRKAFDGKLWDVGFEMTAYMTEGTQLANAALSVLQQNLARINPKFRLKIQALPWATISDQIYTNNNPSLPMAYMGWGPDYSDPGGPLGAATYYLASTGLVAGFSGEGYRELMRKEFDGLLAEAWALNDPDKRRPIYERLQEMSHEYATTQFLWEDYTHVVSRDWVDGYVHNMMLYGAWDFYKVTKSE
ncbi:ABC transporter substrate-binding protein [Nitratireductor sp. PBL-C9]|uniref:ABC transporter substrate-binding protein n=1 Tax=Nitratireductor sp. PBL-C9 TaxID=3435013 RepID=UPI003D7C9D36